uniref:cytidine deaminase n=1 Tax=Nelumbo nucifera TaxID=4432 RepID=A0A822XWJ6_NELNU|nr:TPA_asm: hypothetical protein HUJ06_026161 [Nelumbo nucifera]
MEQARFVIESADVESMAKESGLSLLQLLTSLVKSTQDLARPPISKYHVGAVGLGSDGRVFLGVNLEFPGLPLHHSVHAEQFLITNAAIHGSTRLRYIAVSSAPCGHCRQFMQEIRGASDINILVTSTENEGDNREDVAFRPMSHFLPQRFGPDDLLNKDVPLLLEPHHNGLTFSDDHDEINGEANRCYSNDSVVADYNKLKYAALEAANKSHAPSEGKGLEVHLTPKNQGSFLGWVKVQRRLGRFKALSKFQGRFKALKFFALFFFSYSIVVNCHII